MHAADSAFLLELGLTPAPQRAGKRRRAGADAQPRRWHQPWQLDQLLLDVAALREALAAGMPEALKSSSPEGRVAPQEECKAKDAGEWPVPDINCSACIADDAMACCCSPEGTVSEEASVVRGGAGAG